MIKRIKPAILLLTLMLFAQSICSQNPESMTEYLSQRFLRYCKSVPREEIFIHSDREEYISGEILWFNVYLIDRQSFKPSLRSRIVYFELLNASNRPVVQKRILIDKGIGPGQIVLPDTLSSGMYTIRAYTSWMKNFLPYNCFVKNIIVYNAISAKVFKGDGIKKGVGKISGQEKKNTGITLKVDNSKHDNLELFVEADNKFRSENDNLFYIFIQTHGNINHVSAEKLTGETTNIQIPKSFLTSGISQITLFSSKGEPLSERFIYTPDREVGDLTVHSADSCDLRDKITLEIEPGNEFSKALNGTNLSISVAPLNNNMDIPDIKDYMICGTEYGLSIQNQIKGKKFIELEPEVIDSILLNVRSNWINWSTILNRELPLFKYRMETEDHLLRGRLLTNNQQPVHSSELLLMCSPGKEAAFQYARTDSAGNFSFNIHIDEGVKDLIIMPDDASKNSKIIVESSFSDQYPESAISLNSSGGQSTTYISKLGVNYQVQSIYGVTGHGDPLNPVYAPLKPLKFYGKPDIELILADYISLPVMQEIFFELLPGVYLKKKKSVYEITITEHIGDDLIVTSPCLMIDGVIIKDAAMIVYLDPVIVEKIDVIKGKYLVGKYVFTSIINVVTRAADLSCIQLPEYMIRLPYRVIDPVVSFTSPDYSSEEMKESRIPDYRNTLYWNPSLKPDKDGKVKVEFWSSDNKLSYVINIQGITQEGKTYSLHKSIRVR